MLEEIFNWIQSIETGFRLLVTFFAIFFETSILIGLFVPGDSVALVSSISSHNEKYSLALWFTLIIASICGESLGFWLGKIFGPKLRATRLGKLINESHWTRAQNFVAHRGGPGVFVSRFIPILHSLVPATVGMSNMRFIVFILWTLPACTIWATIYSLAGHYFSNSYSELSQKTHYAGYILAIFALLFILLTVLIKFLAKKFEKKHVTTNLKEKI